MEKKKNRPDISNLFYLLPFAPIALVNLVVTGNPFGN